MILKTDELKSACSKILASMDTSGISALTGMLELKSTNGVLFLNVTNLEYFVAVKLCECAEDFHVTISADLFLKLASQITTETIEFTATEKTLNVKANGNYKFPLIYDGEEILELPRLIINNPTLNFNIDGKILNSILINNSKELAKIPKDSKSVKDVQRLYYVDNEGAITFYNGACVNKFDLEKPVKLLLDSYVVRLFGLFKNTAAVNFTLGYDALSEANIKTKVQFKSDDVTITAILSSGDSLVGSMPAQAIREKAYSVFPQNIVVNRALLLAAIQRLTLFTNNTISYKTCGKFTFTKSFMTMSDYGAENTETIAYSNELVNDLNYEAMFDLIDIKLALESNKDQFISIGFGDHTSMVIAKDNVYTVIPEIIGRTN